MNHIFRILNEINWYVRRGDERREKREEAIN